MAEKLFEIIVFLSTRVVLTQIVPVGCFVVRISILSRLHAMRTDIDFSFETAMFEVENNAFWGNDRFFDQIVGFW